MTELRKQFEALPEINLLLQKDICFSGKEYKTDNSLLFVNVGCLNLAWYAFQEQQKKIDSLLDHVCGSFEDFK